MTAPTEDPRALLDRPGCDLSFSGLKTAVLRARDRIVEEKGGITREDQADLAASFQAAVVEVLAEKTRRAFALIAEGPPPTLCVAGGVASNGAVRAALETVAAEFGAAFIAPPLNLCTDNAAMIAALAAEKIRAGGSTSWELNLNAYPRQTSAVPSGSSRG